MSKPDELEKQVKETLSKFWKDCMKNPTFKAGIYAYEAQDNIMQAIAHHKAQPLRNLVPKAKPYRADDNPLAHENKRGWNACRQQVLRTVVSRLKEIEGDVKHN